MMLNVKSWFPLIHIFLFYFECAFDVGQVSHFTRNAILPFLNWQPPDPFFTESQLAPFWPDIHLVSSLQTAIIC